MSISARPFRVIVSILIALTVGLLLGVVLAPSHASGRSIPARISGRTIVDVSGDAANGFTIRHLDGSTDYTETDSEALAECLGYDTLRARVRCRAQIRTRYADLARMENTIDYFQRLFVRRAT